MSKPLDVSPEHLYTTSAGLAAAESTAGTGIGAASAALVPAPAGADDVSTRTAAAFAGYAETFLQAVGTGLVKHVAGAQTLAPVAAGYQATDAAGSAAISAGGAAIGAQVARFV